ncbi:emp24p/erv25p- protein [Boothiomyces sp. JEL0866]|nr:emp24p/erv25p- protein [Boothiomyces sp. JEL0866]
MKIIALLTTLVQAFHFYAETAEQRCFTEELGQETHIVGAYKAVFYDSSTNAYTVLPGASLAINVYSEASNTNLVDINASDKGKFSFIAAESGKHRICLTAHSTGWSKPRAKIYLDIQDKDDEEVEKKELTKKEGYVNELKWRTKDLLRRERESELREESEVLNSHAYRVTLVQIFVLVLTCAWQLTQLKKFFISKKLV